MSNSLYRQYRIQIRGLASIVIILNLIFLFKIFTIQVLNHNKHTQDLTEETIKVINKKGDRGKILDRNNRILADNMEKFDFWINTTEYFDTLKIVSLFSKTLNKPQEYYMNILDTEDPYLFIEENVEKIDCENILVSINDIAGLRYNVSQKRLYPYDNILSSIIGFSDSKNNNSGIEYLFNNVLSGDEVRVNHKKLDNGKIEYNDTLITPGENIVLTIDVGLQSILRNELKNGVEKSEAKSGNGIIVNPYNGEILAMASFPDFNPNKAGAYNVNYHKNTAIGNNYEPGSTFKIVALAAAIENSVLSLKDSIDCENGEFILRNGHPLHDHEPRGILSVPEIFAYSSNIGMAKISDLLTNQQLYNKSKDFGFGVQTGILLPGEQSGMLRHFNDWSYQSNKSIAMGQEISCTSLQLAMAYSAIANGGYLLDPTIIKLIGNSDIPVNYNKNVREVVSGETSKILIKLLENVVSYGSGSNASISGYKVAGKTGTAQKFVNGSYSDTEYISSFASIFPSENPRYVCVISIDSPNKSKNKHWGNETAAPIVKNIYKNIINLKNIYPESYANHEYDKNNKKRVFKNNIVDLTVVPNFKGKTLKQAIEEGNRIGLKIESLDFSGIVVWQSINPGSTLNKKDICELKITN